MKPTRSRSAYTAIELALVLGVVGMLSGLTAPSMLTAVRRATISEAADAVVRVSSEARELSRRGMVESDYFGVVVGVDGSGGYVALTYGPTATPGDIMMVDGSPVLRIPIDGQARLVNGDQVMAAGESVGWLHQYSSGMVVTTPSQSIVPVSIGVTGSPVTPQFGVMSVDGRYAADVRVFAVGIAVSEIKEP